MKKIEKLITEMAHLSYTSGAIEIIDKSFTTLEEYINKNHFLKTREYLNTLEEIKVESDDLSFLKSKEDRLLQMKIQRSIIHLARKILDENKKIFIVHGRNIVMRDRVSALLGRLRLDYVILESEHNGGSTTIIDKFLRSAQECKYAIILLSADDLGKLDREGSELAYRARQNVILELGFFLSHVGPKNVVILHQVGKQIEQPSDFHGIVYEPFDDFGAWKMKLLKEMRNAGIYIDQNLAERI